MKRININLLGATPVAMEYGWLVASLSAAQAASTTARVHSVAKQADTAVVDPRVTLTKVFDARGTSVCASFNPVAARELPDA